MLYHTPVQAAQATFKSIKSLVPLLDRVLVQRFKHETVRLKKYTFCLSVNQRFFFAENRNGNIPPDIRDV